VTKTCESHRKGATMTNTKQNLRGLANDIRDLAQNHPCYSQVHEIIRVATNHIDALARIEDINKSTDVR
jgi:hypothetical protein